MYEMWRKFCRAYPMIFACTTSVFALGPGAVGRPVGYRCYVVFFGLVHYGCAVYSLHGRVSYVYPHLEVSVATLDLIKWLTLGLLNACMFATLGVGTRCHRRAYRLLGRYLRAVDVGGLRVIVRLNLVGLAFNLLVYAFDNYVWLRNIGMFTHKYYLHQVLQYFLVFLLACVVINVAMALTARLHQLTEAVRCVEAASYKWPPMERTRCLDEQKILQVVVGYEEFARALVAFEDLFGPSLLFLAINVLSEAIEALNLGILYSVQSGKKYFMTEFGSDLIVLCALWALLLVKIMFFILRALGKTRLAHEHFKLAVFNLRVALAFRTDAYQRTLDMVAALQESAHDNRVVFTAAGFFTCDYTLLTSIIASVASQVVTLLQINKDA